MSQTTLFPSSSVVAPKWDRKAEALAIEAIDWIMLHFRPTAGFPMYSLGHLKAADERAQRILAQKRKDVVLSGLDSRIEVVSERQARARLTADLRRSSTSSHDIETVCRFDRLVADDENELSDLRRARALTESGLSARVNEHVPTWMRDPR